MAYRGIEYVTGVAMFIAAFWVYDHMRYARGVYSDVRDKPTPLKTALRLNMVSLMGVSFCLLLTPWYELYRVRPWVAIMGTVAWAILWRMVVRKGLWRPWMILVWGAMLIAGGVYLGGIPERFYLMTVLNYAPTLYLYAVTDKRTVLYRMSAKQSYAREDVQVAAVLFVGGHIYLYWGLTEATAQFLESALANGQCARHGAREARRRKQVVMWCALCRSSALHHMSYVSHQKREERPPLSRGQIINLCWRAFFAFCRLW